ncbi:MAG: ECF-type riboflavin transporter substrate-binding protein [Sphaerochaetaceae bacterium]|nr:ECF-type riboflavin transporter substrate-binding protein [Sphaerochaetaceae bacterium]
MEEKKLFNVTTKTIVATGIGAALFTLLFMYVKIPTGIPNTEIQTAYGVGAFFAALFGPIAGGLIAFIGHAISDSVQYGSAWWSWVIASGCSCFIMGLCYSKLDVENGVFTGKDMLRFNIYQVIANVVSWMLIAPTLDVIIYAEPASLVFTQGWVAALSNAVSAGVIGTLLLFVYSKTRAQKGSLTKEK